MSASSGLTDAWTLLPLAVPGDVSGVRSVALDTTTADGRLRAALTEDGLRRLLLPVGLRAKIPTAESGQGLLIRDVTFVVKGKPTRFVDIRCTTHELDPVFAEVAEAIVDRVKGGRSVEVAVVSSLSDFRELLRKSRPRLSESQVIGLVGELLVVRDMVTLDPASWRLWTGPGGNRHDVEGLAVSMEVKTTIRRSSSVVAISSIDQLAYPAGQSLYLVYIVIEPLPRGPLSVRGLIEDVETLSDDASAFRGFLDSVDLGREVVEGLEEPSYGIVRRRMFAVDDRFPRVTRNSLSLGDLPPGVRDVEYSVDLAFAAESLVDETAESAIMREVASSR